MNDRENARPPHGRKCVDPEDLVTAPVESEDVERNRSLDSRYDARGDILPVVLVSLLFGYVLSTLGHKAKPVKDVIDAGSALVFGSINVLMRLAPIGAFGAMAFTVGRYGISVLGTLFGLV